MSNKKLTPEEIKRLAGAFGNTYRMKIAEGRAAYAGYMEGYNQAVENSAREVAEAEENSTWANDQLQLSQEENIMLKQRQSEHRKLLSEKTALLKEAIGIIKRLKAICSANYNPIHEEIEAFVKKSTGREAV